jgi:hypothetical protein
VNLVVNDKVRLLLLVLSLLAACFLIATVYSFSHEEMMVDRCLSAKHGSFNYTDMTCDLETNHPYVPYRVRHTHDKRRAGVAFIVFAAFLLAYFWTGADKEKP